MDFNSTVKGSLLEGFYPAGWDFSRIDACCANAPESITEPQSFWNKDFQPLPCRDVAEFDVKMGHEIANEIKKAAERGEKIVFILPVGPMGMYKWAVYFLKEWNVCCKHVYCFNMDEWADAEGNTITGEASFQSAMENALYNPLGELTVPKEQRHFATKDTLPFYEEKIKALRAEGAKLVLVFGIGRMCHIAFWEPHFGEEFASDEECLNTVLEYWYQQRLGDIVCVGLSLPDGTGVEQLQRLRFIDFLIPQGNIVCFCLTGFAVKDSVDFFKVGICDLVDIFANFDLGNDISISVFHGS